MTDISRVIRVVLADDHQIIRDGLRALVDQQDGMHVVADAESGRRAVELADELRPQVVIMDVSMPDLNGIEATRRIVGATPTVKVVGLSMHRDKRFIVEMLKAGASGYLLKDCAFDELAQAIHTVMRGQIYLSPAISDVVVEDLVREPRQEASSAFSSLSGREREILQLLAEGKTTKQIALHCHISTKTVETHRHNIMDKLDKPSIAELTKYAIWEGLTPLEP